VVTWSKYPASRVGLTPHEYMANQTSDIQEFPGFCIALFYKMKHIHLKDFDNAAFKAWFIQACNEIQ